MKKIKRAVVEIPKEYPVAQPGQWIQPSNKGFRMACCDCGLVHIMNFRISTKKGKRRIQLQAFRDNKETRKLRRREGIKVTQPRE